MLCIILISTFDVDKIVDSLFQWKLFDKKSLLLFWQFFKKVFQISVPNLCHLRKERFANRLITHVSEDLPHQEVVVSYVWMFGSPLCRFKINLMLFIVVLMFWAHWWLPWNHFSARTIWQKCDVGWSCNRVAIFVDYKILNCQDLSFLFLFLSHISVITFEKIPVWGIEIFLSFFDPSLNYMNFG